MSISVSGGAGGIEAQLDDLLALARVHDEVGDDLRAASARLAAIVAGLAGELELVVAAALSPGSAARAAYETADAAAALLPLTVTTEGSALFLRSAAEAYRAADEVLARAAQGLRDGTGFLVGVAAPGLAAVGAVTYGVSRLLEEAAEAAGWQGGADRMRDSRAEMLTGAQQVLLEYPGALEHVIGGAAGLAQGLGAWLPPGAQALVNARLGYPTSYEEVLASVGLFFPDGNPVLGAGGEPQEGDEVRPVTVRDLLQGVDRRQQRRIGALPGEIGVVQLVDPDGTRRWVVQLPGTESWALQPGAVARDASTNVHTMAGGSTVYMRGVEQALARAGVKDHEAVMLVGHSQGGMTAAALAADEGFGSSYNVTHVVTAGAPVARADVPDHVQVLALENRHDLVPRLDGLTNPDDANITTVTFDDNLGAVGKNHALNNYAKLADQLPADDPSVQAWRTGAGGFLDPRNRVVSHEHERQTISREPAP